MRIPRQDCLAVLLLVFFCERSVSFSPQQFRPHDQRRRRACHARRSPDDFNSICDNTTPLAADTLTLPELSLRFHKVLEHYETTKEMSPDQVRQAMLRTRLENLTLNRCHVGPSTIPNAGQGLFASRDILKDEIITLYPGDALLAWNKAVGDFSGDVSVLFGKHVTNKDAARVISDDARNYEVKIDHYQSLVADPSLVHDAAYLAHLMNDGAACLEDSLVARSAYSQQTVNRYNAVLVPIGEGCHYAAVAAKDIAAHQEVFVSYGEGYWLSRLQKQQAANDATTAGTKWPVKKTKKDKKARTTKSGHGGGGGFG